MAADPDRNRIIGNTAVDPGAPAGPPPGELPVFLVVRQ